MTKVKRDLEGFVPLLSKKRERSCRRRRGKVIPRKNPRHRWSSGGKRRAHTRAAQIAAGERGKTKRQEERRVKFPNAGERE